MLRQALLAVIVSLATVAVPAYGQDVKLRMKFKEGDKFYVEDIAKSKETIGIAGQTVNAENKTTMITSFEVKKVTSDDLVTVMKVENVKVETDAPGGQLAKITEKLKGGTFTITMTQEGKIKKFEGYNEWAKGIVGDDEDETKLLKMFVSEDLLMNAVAQAFGFIPDKAVKKGDTWTREHKYPMGAFGEFKVNSTYTYDGQQDKRDVVTEKQSLRYVPPKAGTEVLGLFKLQRADLKCENARAKYVFDNDKGRLDTATLSMTVSGSLTVDIAGQQQQLEMTVATTSTSRVLDSNPMQK
jgi:hypothetical protein